MTVALAAYDPVAQAVLVLSADAAVRSSLALLLRVEGFAVVVPATVEEAGLAPCSPVGCIVLDHPGRAAAADGLELAALVRLHRDAELILLADGPDEPVLPRAPGLRLLVVLRKPLLDDGIVRWVDRALARAALRADQRP